MRDDYDTIPPPKDTITDARVQTDPVSAPKHYVRLSPEPKDVILSWRLNWTRGSAVGYIARAGHKGDEIEDLRKAVQMIEFEIEYLKRQRG